MLPTAHVAIHLGGGKAIRSLRAEQEMVDPESRVALPGIPQVFPKRVYLFVGMEVPDRVKPALIHELLEGGTNLGPAGKGRSSTNQNEQKRCPSPSPSERGLG